VAAGVLTSEFVGRVNEDLENLGELGGPEVAEVVRRLVRALEPTLRDRFLEATAQLVAELAADGGPEISLSLDADHLRLRAKEDDDALVPMPATGDLTERFALRVSAQMKRDVEREATNEGISLNSWIVRALDRALAPPGRRDRTPHRLRGVGRA
jgi:HicB family